MTFWCYLISNCLPWSWGSTQDCHLSGREFYWALVQNGNVIHTFISLFLECPDRLNFIYYKSWLKASILFHLILKSLIFTYLSRPTVDAKYSFSLDSTIDSNDVINSIFVTKWNTPDKISIKYKWQIVDKMSPKTCINVKAQRLLLEFIKDRYHH